MEASEHQGPGDGPGPGRVINTGVYVTGGLVSGPVAAGAGARAVQVNKDAGHAEVLARIERLLHDLEDGASVLDGEQAGEVTDDVGRLRAEVHHRKPDTDRISHLLGRLTAQVGSAAALLATVDRVKDLVATLLH
jgi:hypothetical protein